MPVYVSHNRFHFVYLLAVALPFVLCALPAAPQNRELKAAIAEFFADYEVKGYVPNGTMKMESLAVGRRSLSITVSDPFSGQPLSSEIVEAMYDDLRERLPRAYRKYDINFLTKKGQNLETLIPNPQRRNHVAGRTWENRDYEGAPWVENISRPYRVSKGLQGRHLMIWPSHGSYYDRKKDTWRWQRPYLFCSSEDLLTQAIALPCLFPMLENAGAIVYCPRERDVQTLECVVDNDSQGMGVYTEESSSQSVWGQAPGLGFAPYDRALQDGDAPFRHGTARQAPTTAKGAPDAALTAWTPCFARAGDYAVYVSYKTTAKSVSDALYTIRHRGGATQVHVNQQMGGGTWVYLGTYAFDEGLSENGQVILSTESGEQGVVTADAVRFGGGMGQTMRGGRKSNLPRHLEGARYYAQASGMPEEVFYTAEGENDYLDDVRSRALATNYIAGGSVFLPGGQGLRVPLELSLALHTDAGVRPDNSIYGTLSISTTEVYNGADPYPSRISRYASSDLADALQTQLVSDLSKTFRTTWTRRERWDRNYHETRVPAIPSAILEMLSHQNFTDMRYAHDPNFRFALARGIYKALLRYVNYQHDCEDVVVQPLPPRCFAALLNEQGTEVTLSWEATPDPLEPTAQPTAYVVYTRSSDGGWNNGRLVEDATSLRVPVAKGVQYAFKVTAVNCGGESFPSETLSAYASPNSTATVLIVNGFNRLSGPAVVMNGDSLGFLLKKDMGVPYLYATHFAGEQVDFNPRSAGVEGGLGLSGCLWEGKRWAGNTFDYPCAHGEAIAAAGNCSFASVGNDAVKEGKVRLTDYPVVDYIAGLEKDASYNLFSYKTFDAATREQLTAYLRSGGRLMVSGSYIGSDMMASEEERDFTREWLKYSWGGSARQTAGAVVGGLNISIPIYGSYNAEHYAAVDPDIILPAGGTAFPAFAYSSGQCAGIAYKGFDYSVLAMGFPFECISDENIRALAMGAILEFLLSQ